MDDLPEYLIDDNDMDYLSVKAYWSYFGGCGIPNRSSSTGKLVSILDNMQTSQKSTHTFSEIISWILTKETRDFRETILAMAEGPLEGHMYAIMIHAYRNGILGCEVDHKEAYNYAVKSAECGNLIGKAWSGFYLSRGEFVEMNTQKGTQLLIESANLGFPMAQHEVGLLYIYVNPTQSNIRRGLEYLNMATDQSYNRSLTQLGDLLRIGQVPSKDENGVYGRVKIFDVKKCFYFFKSASDNGDSHGMFVVATMYKNGEGVEQNISKAKQYYRMAFYAGYKHAVFELKELEGW